MTTTHSRATNDSQSRAPTSEWQGKTRPAAIVRCLSVEDVIHTVRWTRAWATAFSSRCRTRDFRTMRENGVVIDLSQMSYHR